MRSSRFLGISFFLRPHCGFASSSRNWASGGKEEKEEEGGEEDEEEGRD